jgi:thymidylate synthase (FAD)
MVEITLLARPVFEEAYRAFLLAHLPPEDAQWEDAHSQERGNSTDAERLVEFAGRVCYLSFGHHRSQRSNAEYISNLIRRGHDSVLEHATWTFVLAGVSRAFTHQLVRHRVGFSYSQLSQQYHDERRTPVIRPAELDRSARAAEAWDAAIAAGRAAYETISNELGLDEPGRLPAEARRALRSAARSVLPNAMESIIVVTANARAIRHFLKLRGGIEGDPEMRLVSAALVNTLRPEAPALFADFVVSDPGDGLPLVSQVPL